MPAIVWAKSSKIGYLSRAWPAPTCCIYSLLSNYLVLKTLYFTTDSALNYITLSSLHL